MSIKQVVLISGGTQGIGLGLAKAFMSAGIEVALCGQSTLALEDFRRAHPSSLAVRADVTVTNDREAMLDEVNQRFG